MKHIKYFENDNLRGIESIPSGPKYSQRMNQLKKKKSLIFNLEDCLQEIFDEYKIPKQEGRIDITSNLSWWSNYDSVTIEQIPPKIFNKIKIEIIKLQPIIEERVYNKILIYDEKYTGNENENRWITIKLRKKKK